MHLAGPLDLPASLQGGQAFRWTREGDVFRGVVAGRAVRLRALPAGAAELLDATDRDAAALADYLRLEPADLERRKRLALDPVLAPALREHAGLRLLRQDPWETTVAFLTSANNNVLRIERIVRGIAARYGEPLDDGQRAFPSPERLARVRESTLRSLGLGYRAPFLRETARMVAARDVDVDALRGASWSEAREALLRLPGVGPKVADCIALFSLDVDEAFPIDRWVLRAVSDAFFAGAPLKPADVETFARERWGADAGLAQQFLFHALRARQGAPGTRRPPA